jgi:hypothetical protein
MFAAQRLAIVHQPTSPLHYDVEEWLAQTSTRPPLDFPSARREADRPGACRRAPGHEIVLAKELRDVRRLRGPALIAILPALALASAPSSSADVFDCDEYGVANALGTPGGPHTFSCAGPTTLTINGGYPFAGGSVNAILDGEDELSLSGGDTNPVLAVGPGQPLELRRMAIVDGQSHGAAGGCIAVASGASLTLVEVTLSGCATWDGIAHNLGGAISNDGALALVDSAVTDSTGSFGSIASGYGSASASLSLTRSRVYANPTSFGFGGIYVVAGGFTLTDSAVEENAGGGLLIAGVGARTITGSSISRNVAIGGNTGFGVTASQGSLAITNSTLAENGWSGLMVGSASVEVANSTIADNGNPAASAISGGGSGNPTLRNTILAGTCSAGTRSSLGGNLESPGNGCNLTHASDQVSVSAAALALGALGEHGGPTETVPLLPHSAAIGAGVACPPPASDQRGVARPQGAGCDAGAYELEYAVPLGGVAWLAAALLGSGALALRRVARQAKRAARRSRAESSSGLLARAPRGTRGSPARSSRPPDAVPRCGTKTRQPR